MTNKEKFLDLVSESDTKITTEIKTRIKDRAMLRESQKIALKVLMKLDELGWTQRDLARKMNVSPQQISKIVSGKENLTLKTQIKIQDTLDIPVLASYYDEKLNQLEEIILTIGERIDKLEPQNLDFHDDYQSSQNKYSKTFDYKHLSAA